MLRRRAVMTATALSVLIWCAAPILFLIVRTLPQFEGWTQTGCHTTDALLPYVNCTGTGLDRVLEPILLFGMYWMPFGIVYFRDLIFEPKIAAILLPVQVLWLLSLFLAGRAVYRLARHWLQPKANPA